MQISYFKSQKGTSFFLSLALCLAYCFVHQVKLPNQEAAF